MSWRVETAAEALLPGLIAHKLLIESVLSGRVLEQADELTGSKIVGRDGAAAIGGSGAGELTDEQFVAKDTEVKRRERLCPRAR